MSKDKPHDTSTLARRNYFAGLAMHSLVASHYDGEYIERGDYKMIAFDAAAMADALITALAAGGSE